MLSVVAAIWVLIVRKIVIAMWRQRKEGREESGKALSVGRVQKRK